MRAFCPQPKPQSRSRDKYETAKAALKAWLAIKRAVRARDGNRCRACSSRLNVEPHHIQFRSKGGTHSLKNVACLCRICHDDVHAYRLAVLGEDANKTLQFVRTR